MINKFVVSSIFSLALAASPLLTVSLNVYAADNVVDNVKSKVRGERAEEKMEDHAESTYEAAKETAEDKYDVKRERCESQKGTAERTCKKQARATYKNEIAAAKTELKNANMHAHSTGETH